MRRLVLFALSVALAGNGAAQAEIGRIKRSMGTAAVQRGTARMPAAVGAGVEQGDVLVTGRDGRVSITFADNSRFSAGPNSRITLSQFQFNEATRKGAFVTKVDRGSLAIVSGQIAHETKDAMKVRTPTSLLGVRGTRFVVNVP
ncbi:FecR family protein [Sphingomonas profundi]|uniref:FecR family protein n=1 Tax=Alterirhizorhabdus profundi TaxID=2681549 RepID=UPI0012E70880|nr:FecR domain-containing protein [Sphingomonas profundi]